MSGVLKAVVVGCRRGRSHAVPIAALDSFELIGLCDLDRDAAESLAAETGSPPVFTDYAEMLWAQGGKASGGYRYGHPIEDGAMALIEFEDGVRAELLCGDVRLPGRGYQDVEVFGTGGRLWRASDRAEIPLQIQDASGGWREVPLDEAPFESADPDTRSYELFADTVTSGAVHPLSSETALREFEVVVGVYESARLNSRIEFPMKQDRFPLEMMIEDGRA